MSLVAFSCRACVHGLVGFPQPSVLSPVTSFCTRFLRTHMTRMLPGVFTCHRRSFRCSVFAATAGLKPNLGCGVTGMKVRAWDASGSSLTSGLQDFGNEDRILAEKVIAARNLGNLNMLRSKMMGPKTPWNLAFPKMQKSKLPDATWFQDLARSC